MWPLHALHSRPSRGIWWASRPPLSASGPYLNVSVGREDLERCGKTLFNVWILFQNYIFWPPGVKIVIWPFLDLFPPFQRTSWMKRKKMHETKNFCHIDTYLVNLFYLFPKLHILANRCQKVVFWQFYNLFFDHSRGLPYWKEKSCVMSISTWNVFFVFSFSGKASKWQKTDKKVAKLHNIGCTFSCVHVRLGMHTNIINQLRRPILTYAESFVKIWLHLADILRCVTSLTKTKHTCRQTQHKFILDRNGQECSIY